MERHWEPLGQGLRVLVSPSHGFSTDTLLLADFSMPKANARCADLGSGCGVIPLLWCHRGRPGSVLALEVQKDAVELMETSVRDNGMEGRIAPVLGDIRDYKSLLPHQSLDLMASNPPYFAPGTGAVSRDPERGLARHSQSFQLSDLAGAAFYSLRHGGRLCICLPSVRLTEAVCLFHDRGLEPKRLRLVQQRPGKEPYLFLLECRKGGGAGLVVEETLVLTDGSGNYSLEMGRIYGDYLESNRKEPSNA